MMKANNQLGFININEDSIDKIIKDDEVIFERGFLREKTSTTLPTTFDGVGKDLKDYRVYGNTYQNSTNGKNKFDINQNVTYKSTRISCNVVNDDIVLTALTDYNGNAYCVKPIPNSSSLLGQTVTLSGNMQRSSQGTFRIIIGFLNSNGTYVSDLGSATAVTVDGQHKTFSIPNTFPTGATQIGLLIYFSRTEDTSLHQGDTVTYSNIQLEIGSNKTSYEKYTGGQPSPNPDYLQEIISCGDRTKNLFLTLDTPASAYRATYSKINKNSFSLNYNQENSSNSSSYVRIDFDVSQFKPNTQYTISKKNITSGVDFNNAGAIRSYINGSNGSVITGDSFTFTTPNEITRLGIYFYLGYNNTIQGESTITFYDIQIEENSSATPYEPYGYKIPVNVRSDNLFDKDNANLVHLYTDGTVIKNSAGANTYYIKCKSNTTYTIIKSNTGTNNRFCVFTCDDIPTAGIQILNYIGTSAGADNSVKYTINTPNTAKYLCVFVGVASTTPSANEISNSIMIVEDSTSPSKYIPYYNETTNIYLDEPLRKIDEYSDYIDFINGKVVRQLGENIPNLNDLSLNTNYTNVEYVRFLKPTDFVGYDLFGNYYLLCSHAIYSANPNNWDSSSNTNKLYTGAERKSWWIGFEKGTGLDTIKQKLEGCSVIYRLATPTQESITLPNIPTVDGNNTLNIETEITPSKVYIKYKSNN